MEFITEDILDHLRDSICRKRPELRRAKNWLLLHDNGPSYRSIRVLEDLSRQHVTVFPRPPYSPDLAPRFLAEKQSYEGVDFILSKRP